MTVWAAFANGNLTSASTWEQIDATSYSNSESANTALTTSYVESTAFTPGAITIDGIAFKIASRAASPTGTLNIRLALGGVTVAGTEIQVNVSDLPTCTNTSGTTTPVFTAEGGWFFVKFAAPVTLAGATAYTLSLKTSSSSQVNAWSASGSNWSRYLRTTTTGAPAATDDIVITGEWTAAATVTARTVTMDSTAATVYGSNTTSQVTPAVSITNNGTLTFGTSASTAYQLVLKGYVIVYNGGTLNVGTAGTPVPSGSTATFQFTCTADGDFGIVCRNGATFNSYGVPRTAGKLIVQTFLTASAAAAATSLTVNDDTGWLNLDKVCLAPTQQTFTEVQQATLNGNAGASTLTLSAGITNARNYNASPLITSEIGLLTHNVVFTGNSTTVQPFFCCGPTAVVNIQWTEFDRFGTNSTNAANEKLCIVANTTTGSFNMQYSSIHDCRGTAFGMTGTNYNNITLSRVVFSNTNTAGAIGGFAIILNGATTGTNWTLDHVFICGVVTASNTAGGVSLGDLGGTITSLVISGCNATNGSFQLSEINNAPNPQIGTYNGITIHSCQGTGLAFTNSAQGQIQNLSVYRCTSTGVSFSSTPGPTTQPINAQSIKTGTIFGCSTGISFGGNSQAAGAWILDSVTIAGDTTFGMTNATTSWSPGSYYRFINCSISVATGIYVAATGTDLNGGSPRGSIGDCVFDNCLFRAGAPTITNFGNNWGPTMTFMNYQQVANDHRSWYCNDNGLGSTLSVIQTDTGTVYPGDIRSEKMTPGVQFNISKFQSSPIQVAVNSGQKATVSLQIQKNAAYNGAAPRLMLRRDDSLGVTGADSVLATFSAGSGTWQNLTGSSPAALRDGVFEFYVDCDGNSSTGAIFIGGEIANAA